MKRTETSEEFDTKVKTPLSQAAGAGYIAIVNLLLSRGVKY